MFTAPLIDGAAFRAAVAHAAGTLGDAGFDVIGVLETDTFARLRVHDPAGQVLDVDFAVNWRAEAPVQMSLGPVLSERDAVAGKLSAVYSRGEIRDFLDLDAIRSSGWYTDEQLLVLGKEDDVGFDRAMFAAQLSRVVHFEAEEAEEYGITARDVTAMQRRILAWARQLRDGQVPGHRPGTVRRSRPERQQGYDAFSADPARRRPDGPSHGHSL